MIVTPWYMLYIGNIIYCISLLYCLYSTEKVAEAAEHLRRAVVEVINDACADDVDMCCAAFGLQTK